MGVSDSVLSKHVKQLEDDSYLALTKSSSGSRVRTKAALTAAGRRAYADHVAELQRLIAGDPAGAPSSPAPP